MFYIMAKIFFITSLQIINLSTFFSHACINHIHSACMSFCPSQGTEFLWHRRMAASNIHTWIYHAQNKSVLGSLASPV